ncbi:MAG TPA: DUF1614 domain-containing protein [Ktedonobacterales bacterium]
MSGKPPSPLLSLTLRADLLNLSRLQWSTFAQIASAAKQGILLPGKRPGEYCVMASIGGAVVFDDIFLTGIVAPLLTTL